MKKSNPHLVNLAKLLIFIILEVSILGLLPTEITRVYGFSLGIASIFIYEFIIDFLTDRNILIDTDLYEEDQSSLIYVDKFSIQSVKNTEGIEKFYVAAVIGEDYFVLNETFDSEDDIKEFMVPQYLSETQWLDPTESSDKEN